MLADRANLLIKKIDEVENQRNREIKKRKYSSLSSQLKKEKQRIDNLIEIKYVLGKNIENISMQSILIKLDEIKEHIDYENVDERAGTELHLVLDKIESQLKLEWKKHCQLMTGGVVTTLTNVKPFFSNEDEIDEIIKILNRYENTWPINREKYDRFNKDITLAKNKINTLELTDEIRKFIRIITSNNATLADITPSILKWINDNKYENKIKLRFK